MLLQEMNLLEETINEAVKDNLKHTSDSDNVKISDKDTTTTELATDASSIVICVEDTVSPSSDLNQHLFRSR